MHTRRKYFLPVAVQRSSNTAIMAAVQDLGCRHIISSPLEHHATLHTTEYLHQTNKAKLSHVKVFPDGHMIGRPRKFIEKHRRKKPCNINARQQRDRQYD